MSSEKIEHFDESSKSSGDQLTSVSVIQNAAGKANGQLSNDQPATVYGLAGRIIPSKPNEEQQLKMSEQEKIREQEQKISVLNVRIDKLRTESKVGDLSALVRLADGKVDLGLKRQKAIVKLNIGGIADFLNSSTPKTLKSEFFFCDGLAWSVEARIQKLGGVRYLSVFLRATNFADANADWSTEASYQITVLNRNPLFNASLGFFPLFSSVIEFSKRWPSWGWNKFITIDDLCSGGYIENDEVQFRVELGVKKIWPPSPLQEYHQKDFLPLYVLKSIILIVLLLALVKLLQL